MLGAFLHLPSFVKRFLCGQKSTHSNTDLTDIDVFKIFLIDIDVDINIFKNVINIFVNINIFKIAL